VNDRVGRVAAASHRVEPQQQQGATSASIYIHITPAVIKEIRTQSIIAAEA
jgi:hypothetical protein